MGAPAAVLPGAGVRIAIAFAHSREPSTTDSHAEPGPDRYSLHTIAQPVYAAVVQPRHRTRGGYVTGTMTYLRGALPLVRALILAGLAIYVILFALPAVFGMAAAATP